MSDAPIPMSLARYLATIPADGPSDRPVMTDSMIEIVISVTAVMTDAEWTDNQNSVCPIVPAYTIFPRV